MDLIGQDNQAIVAAVCVLMNSPIADRFHPRNWNLFALKADPNEDFHISAEEIYASIAVGEVQMILPIQSFLKAFDADYVDFKFDISDDILNVSGEATQG